MKSLHTSSVTSKYFLLLDWCQFPWWPDDRGRSQSQFATALFSNELESFVGEIRRFRSTNCSTKTSCRSVRLTVGVRLLFVCASRKLRSEKKSEFIAARKMGRNLQSFFFCKSCYNVYSMINCLLDVLNFCYINFAIVVAFRWKNNNNLQFV